MEEKIKELSQYLSQQKCKNIALIDLTKDKRLAKYMFVVTVNSNLENKKFADKFKQDFSIEADFEGYNKGEWIIFDLDEIIIHSFIPSAREKYNLDKLWQNKKIDIQQSKISKK